MKHILHAGDIFAVDLGIQRYSAQAEADAEFVRQRGRVAHVYVVSPASAGIARPARLERRDRVRWSYG